MIPRATNFLRRALRMFFANPKLFSKSEKRRTPERASRTTSRDHHSPMVSSERATGHRLAFKDLWRIGPGYLILLNLVASLYQILASYLWLHHATRLKRQIESTDPPAPSRMKYESQIETQRRETYQ